MALGIRDIRIRFGGDAKGLRKATSDGQRIIKGFSDKVGGTLRRVGEIAAGVFSGQVIGRAVEGVKQFVGGSVEAASNLAESLNAVNQIFKGSADEIHRWGQANANSLGLSRRAFNDLAVPLGAMLKNAGLSLPQVTDWTKKLTERAADMASVFNTDVSEALTAIQAGLRGETDPLERFGVSLSAARVEAAALAATGKKSAKDLTDQEKATARLNLIMQQTADTAGDFRRNSDGLANSQRIAAARAEELQAKIGEKLAPVVAKVTELKVKLLEVIDGKVLPAFERLSKSDLADWVRNKLVPGLRDLGQRALELGQWVMSNVIPAVAGFGRWLVKYQGWLIPIAAGIGAVVVALKVYKTVVTVVQAVTRAWIAVQTILNVVLTANPIGLIVLAIVALAAAFVVAWKRSETFRNVVTAVFNAIKGAALAVGRFFKDTLWPWIRDSWNRQLAIAKSVWEWLKGLPDRIKTRFAQLAGIISAPFRSAFNRIADLWNGTVGRLRFSVPSWVPGLGGKSFSLPQLPKLARGGRILESGAAIVGERGPEVVHLPQGATVAPLDRAGGPEVIEVHLDLGEGIRQVVEINLRRRDRRLRRRVLAGVR
ncbi:MAG TPA: hypothetical protein VF202_01055 [Trueperaceae bacterium]